MEEKTTKRRVAVALAAMLACLIVVSPATALAAGGDVLAGGAAASQAVPAAAPQVAPSADGSLLVSAATGSASLTSGLFAQQAPESYDYAVTPILSPFNWAVYVKTDNLDPSSFRLVDTSSTLPSEESPEKGVYKLLDRRYLDVAYDSATSYRVNGGYIFYNANCDADGGSLMLQVKSSDGSWEDTPVQVSCPRLTNAMHYLLETYADSATGVQGKLRAIQEALDQIAVYPRTVYDMDSPNESAPYPRLASSPYREIGLNPHYDMYLASRQGLFVSALYPYVLDSLGFPSAMASCAYMLDPNCSVSRDPDNHAYIAVAAGGSSGVYGGAGAGSFGPIYSKFATCDFRFDGSDGDLGTSLTIEEAYTRYMRYVSDSNQEMGEYYDQVRGEQFRALIGNGSWIRIATEGRSQAGMPYAYITKNEHSTVGEVSDAWVDGRYVNANERFLPGEVLENHLDSRIIVRDVEFIEPDGAVLVAGLSYWGVSGTWHRFVPTGYSLKNDGAYPETISLAEAKQMGFDANTNRIPEGGLVFNGQKPAGTPFSTVYVEGVSLPQTMTFEEGDWGPISATITPANADIQNVIWKSSNEGVIWISGGNAYADRPGTATLTATTVDGGYVATCEVTVKERSYDVGDPDDWSGRDGGGSDGRSGYADASEESGGARDGAHGSSAGKAKGSPGSRESGGRVGYAKKANPMTAKAKKKTLSVGASKVQSKNHSIAKKKAFKVTKAKGAVTFKVVKYDKKAGKRLRVTKAGKVIVKKRLPRNTYTMKVRVSALGNDYYKPKSKVVKLKIRIR